MRNCVPIALALVGFVLLPNLGCSSGSSDLLGIGATTSAMIGPMGGQLVLPDGGGMLVIPAGALAATTRITITAIDPADYDPLLAGAVGVRAFEIAPVGLVLAQPATLVFVDPLGTPEGVPEGPGAPTQILIETRIIEVENPASLGIGYAVDAAAGTSTASVDLAGLGRAVKFESTFYNIEINFPTSIVAGTSDVVQVEFIATGDYDFEAVPTLQWSRVDSGSNLTSSLPLSPTPFGGTSPAPTTPGTGLSDSFTLGCPAGSMGSETFVLSFLIAPLDVTNNVTGSRHVYTSAVTATSFDVTCKPVGGGVQQQLIDVGPFIQGIEAMNPLPVGLSCKGPNGLDFVVAGQQTVSADPKVIIVDPVAGLVTEQFDLPGGFPIGPAFDAQFVMPPPGAGGLDPRLVASGNGTVEKTVQAGCSLSPISGFGVAFNLDTSYVAGDPALGIMSANAGGIDLRYLEQVATGLVLEQIPLGSGAKTGIGNATRDRFLVVNGQNQLVNVFWDGMTAIETVQNNITLGANPRRIRWDPASGIVAISDLTDDTVTVLFWNGAQNVVLIGTVPVGAGPVGLDVMGGKIVCAGYDDGSISFIDVDPMALQITGTTTTANPFPLGQNPGHAIFLRDPANSIAISYNGNARIGLLPNAF